MGIKANAANNAPMAPKKLSKIKGMHPLKRMCSMPAYLTFDSEYANHADSPRDSAQGERVDILQRELVINPGTELPFTTKTNSLA